MEKMLRHVRFPGAELPTAPSSFDGARSDSSSSSITQQPTAQRTGSDAATLRRLRKWKGNCQPLGYDIPPNVQPENLSKRMGNFQAGRVAPGHEQKMKRSMRRRKQKTNEMKQKVPLIARRQYRRLRGCKTRPVGGREDRGEAGSAADLARAGSGFVESYERSQGG